MCVDDPETWSDHVWPSLPATSPELCTPGRPGTLRAADEWTSHHRPGRVHTRGRQESTNHKGEAVSSGGRDLSTPINSDGYSVQQCPWEGQEHSCCEQ